jgi:hypothetical protein
MFTRILCLDAEDLQILHFDPEAHEFFVDWMTHLQNRLRGGELTPATASQLGKYPKLFSL